MKDQNNFILFAHCIPVKGSNRSLICDLERENFEFIPNSLFEILDTYSSYTLKEIKKAYGNNNDEIIDEYFNFLEEKEFIYSCEASFIEYFPKLNDNWNYPAYITNTIIDCIEIPEYVTKGLIMELDKLGCKHIQFRVFDQISIYEFLDKVIKNFKNSGIATISIQIPFQDIDFKHFSNKLKEFPRLNEIVLGNAPKNQIDIVDASRPVSVICIQKSLSSKLHCGVVDEKYFAINIPHYTESLHHNTCLNRKISIDTDGNIKNCPSMKESYGNIRDTTLKEAIEKPGFKKYWNITKDQITKCKDCEFRHVCTDCRAYLENPEDPYSAPLKCGYNPYTCEWEEWSTNPLKQKAIDYYGMRELLKKEPKN